jgi:hypothetical protein
MRSVIKTYQSMSPSDKAAFNALKAEESTRLGKAVTTSELMHAVTPDTMWAEAESQAA